MEFILMCLLAILIGTIAARTVCFKPKPQPAAKKGYVCKICNYVYEGDELPQDYECPLCGVGPDQFEEE